VPEEKPKVLYLLGTGRSGSTILGITLGNCADMFCAGELHLWLGHEGTSPVRGAERERFWNRVRDEVTVPPDFPHEQARWLEKSADLFRIGSWRAQRRMRAPFRRITEQLYGAVARTAGATHVVDTSHFPRRAGQLQALEGIDLYLLYIVRSPQNVVASYSRDDVEFAQFNLITTNAYLWLTHLLSLRVFLRHPRERRLLVRYEDFVAAPEAVLRDIFDCVGSSAAVPDLKALDTGVAFEGNPTLRSGVVALERQPDRPGRGSLVTKLLNLPLTAVLSRLKPAASTAADTARPG
jgi:Sulfotransferase family